MYEKPPHPLHLLDFVRVLISNLRIECRCLKFQAFHPVFLPLTPAPKTKNGKKQTKNQQTNNTETTPVTPKSCTSAAAILAWNATKTLSGMDRFFQTHHVSVACCWTSRVYLCRFQISQKSLLPKTKLNFLNIPHIKTSIWPFQPYAQTNHLHGAEICRFSQVFVTWKFHGLIWQQLTEPHVT